MSDAATGLAGIYGIFILFWIALGILWFLLPFAVFGIKGRLDYSTRLQQQILDELKALRKDGKDGKDGSGGAS